MERTTEDIMCYLVLLFVGLAFVLDLLGAAWAAIKKKEYKSLLGEFIEKLSYDPKLWWLPVLIAVLFIYGLKVVGFFE